MEKNNKLIAAFMGWEKLSTELWWKSDYCDDGAIPEEDLKYHSSWGWLIPVCHKIARINPETIETNILRMPSWEFGSIGLESQIEVVYRATVEFIKWYNQQKEK